MEVMREETFGPVLAFMKVGDDLDQAFEYANDTIFGLSSYFFSKDARNCYLAAQRLEAGSIWINDIHGSFIQAPYGGMKASGIGREQGSIAVDDYLRVEDRLPGDELRARGARACVHPD
jgi:acyl-CoA reductase-like NAD-dependent aldehyde dehydrogenase